MESWIHIILHIIHAKRYDRVRTGTEFHALLAMLIETFVSPALVYTI